MIKTNRVIHTGDETKEIRTSAVWTDLVLSEISRLYLDRCRAMREGNSMAVELYNREIASLKVKLAKLQLRAEVLDQKPRCCQNGDHRRTASFQRTHVSKAQVGINI